VRFLRLNMHLKLLGLEMMKCRMERLILSRLMCIFCVIIETQLLTQNLAAPVCDEQRVCVFSRCFHQNFFHAAANCRVKGVAGK